MPEKRNIPMISITLSSLPVKRIAIKPYAINDVMPPIPPLITNTKRFFLFTGFLANFKYIHPIERYRSITGMIIIRLNIPIFF